MTKKILFFILLFNLISTLNLANADIFPLKKPIQTKEETQKKLLIDVLKPLPKPIPKTAVEEIKEKKVGRMPLKRRAKSELRKPKSMVGSLRA